MKFPTLYGKSSSGKILIWEVFTDENNITVRHGQLGGKIQEKVTQSFGKNKGKANATTDSEQAILEAESKHTKQQKKGYYFTKEEAIGHVEWTPMKLQDYFKQGHKISFPCYVQLKLDGQRIMIRGNGDAISKQGENETLPTHIKSDIDLIFSKVKNLKGLDGEIYCGLPSDGGLALQEIISAFRKENENTHKLQYWIYDIPDPEESFLQRVEKLSEIHGIIKDNNITSVKVCTTSLINGLSHLTDVFEKSISLGHEGIVVRNTHGMYEFGKRSYNAQKMKGRETTEAHVILVDKDKNGQGVLTCELENGVKFKCLMKKDADLTINLREYNNALTLIGKWIEFEYEDLSKDGTPLKPVGIRQRDVNILTKEGV